MKEVSYKIMPNILLDLYKIIVSSFKNQSYGHI